MNEALTAPPPAVLQALVQAAEKYDVPLNLLVGVAWIESRYQVGAVSPQGAMGLMQLMPATARMYGVTDPFNIVQSADAGARMLKMLFTKYSGWEQALAAYNWGSGNVSNRPNREQWPVSVQRYTDDVREAARMATARLPFLIEVVLVSPSGVSLQQVQVCSR